MPDYILFIPTFILVGGAIIVLLADLLPYPSAKGWVATCAIGVSLASLLLAWRHPWPIETTLFEWQPAAEDLPQVTFTYYLDAITFMVLVCCLFAALGLLLYANYYISAEPRHQLVFYVAVLLVTAAFVNLTLSGNVLVVYIGLQIWIIANSAIMAFWHHGMATTPSIARSFILASLPSTAVLLAALILAGNNPSLNFSAISPQSVAPVLLLLFLLSAAALSCQYPFHPWAAANFRLPLPAAALLGMAFSPWAGVYLLSRFHAITGPQIETLWHQSLMVVGALTMVAGSVYTVKQTHLKGIAIFTALAQFGYAFLGLGINTPASIAAAFLTLISATLALGGMMVCAGAIERSTGTGSVLKLGSLARHMPHTALLFAFFSLALSGVPFPTVGFFAKWVLLGAAIDANHVAFGILTLVVDVLVFVVLVRTMDWVFFRSRYRGALQGDERNLISKFSAGMMAVPIFFFGVAPFLLLDWFVKPAVSLVVHVPTSELRISLSGGFTAGGFFPPTITFLLMFLPPVIGLVAYMVTFEIDQPQGIRRRRRLAQPGDVGSSGPVVEKSRVALFPWVINTSGIHVTGWHAIVKTAQALRKGVSPTEASYSPMAILLAALTVLLALLE